MKSVVLHSGGLDSTTLLAQAIVDGAEEVLAVSVMYGSLHNEAESQAAEKVIEWFQEAFGPVCKVERLVIELPKMIFSANGSTLSALMGETEMPHMTYQEIRDAKGPSPTVVPFRNANLLSIATALADARGFDFVYIGAHGDDAREWAYPDCTPEFLGAMANAIRVGTYDKVRLIFPFIWMTKADIVARALEVDAPLQLTWSCYNPVPIGPAVEDGFIHCGACPTCIERAQAFADCGFLDPTGYIRSLGDILEHVDFDGLEEWPNV